MATTVSGLGDGTGSPIAIQIGNGKSGTTGIGGGIFDTYLVNSTKQAVAGANGTTDNYVNMDGFDLVWSQAQLQAQMANVESDIVNIENNANLSDTEKMFSMQMAINTWSAISLTRTNELKTIADTLKSITRNID